ncbi:CadC family transcriptional regulator [Salmonella enterica]|nr:CadC family transcriptional regulator [Salmonella enterica]
MQQPVVRIGEWLVTPSVNQISRQGRQITLEPRLIDLLMYFAHHPDEVLSRDNIIDHVWMRTIVTNHVVTQSISELRKSLRDGGDSNAEYIVTVPKRGYKLTAPVIWCEENSDEIDNSSTSPPPIAATNAEPTEGVPAAAPVPPASLQTPTKKAKKPRIAAFWTWVMFLLSLATLVVFIVMSVVDHNAAVTKTRLLLNPRDIDVRFEGGNSCNNWVSQESYAIGLGGLITDLLNTYSTFMVHDKTNYRVNEPSSSGKTLTIQFVNQRHYRAQQCFMSVVLIDNADGSTMLGTALAGIIYIAATQVIAGMFPASVMASSGAPFAISTSTILGGWAAPLVSAFTAFACLTSLGSWMMLVGQAGVRAANDGNFPKIYGEMDKNGIPKKGLLLAAVKMTALMILITIMNSSGGKASDLFGELTGIAVLLTMLPYFYSCVDLIRFEGFNIRNSVSLICSVLGCAFCFIALMGASSFELSGTFIVSLIILMFYGRKMHQRQNNDSDNNTAEAL